MANQGERRRKRKRKKQAPTIGEAITKGLVDEITKRLTAEGVKVFVQPAVTTNSYYLTLDGGRLKKLRVADHVGKGYRYTFEIGPHLQREDVQESYRGWPFTRHLFGFEDVDELIKIVLDRRANQ